MAGWSEGAGQISPAPFCFANPNFVTPAKAGVQLERLEQKLDSGFRRNDDS
jgi:hypothetical protein